MKSKRIKAQPLTREEFDLLLERIAINTTELRRTEAERDRAIQQIQTNFAGDIARIEGFIKADAALCEKYAEAHRAELLPGKAKSAETGLVRFGFRTGNRTVALLNKACSWEAAVKLLRVFKLRDCIRVILEVNKEKILELTNDEGVIGEGKAAMHVSVLGLKIKQAETFFIKPKVDGAETVKGGAS